MRLGADCTARTEHTILIGTQIKIRRMHLQPRFASNVSEICTPKNHLYDRKTTY